VLHLETQREREREREREIPPPMQRCRLQPGVRPSPLQCTCTVHGTSDTAVRARRGAHVKTRSVLAATAPPFQRAHIKRCVPQTAWPSAAAPSRAPLSAPPPPPPRARVCGLPPTSPQIRRWICTGPRRNPTELWYKSTGSRKTSWSYSEGWTPLRLASLIKFD